VRCIAGYELWIGHVGDVRDLPAVLTHGIEALVDLAGNEPPVATPRGLAYFRLPLVDGSDNPAWLLRAAVSLVRSLLVDEVPTLVFCSAGMSRSPAIAAAAIASIRQCSMHDSLGIIEAEHGGDVSHQRCSRICKQFFPTSAGISDSLCQFSRWPDVALVFHVISGCDRRILSDDVHAA